MSNAIKLFSVDLTTELAKDAVETQLEAALAAARKLPRIDSFFGYSATQVYVIVVAKHGETADIYGLTHERCAFNPNAGEMHVCVGAGALIRNLAAMAAAAA